MILDMRRLLGLAFAAADLLLEVDADGRIALAIGAGKALTDAEAPELAGRPCLELFHPCDRPLAAALIEDLSEGERRGPVVARLAGLPPRAGRLRAFRLPQGEGVSLAITPAPLPPRAGVDGLRPAADFESAARGMIEAARISGEELELAMVEIVGLAAARKGLSSEAASAFDARLAAELRLRSQDGAGAARLGDERFALLRAQGRSAAELAGALTRALGRQVGAGLSVEASALPLDPAADTALALKAMRFALEGFASDGFKPDAQTSLAEAVNSSMQRALSRAGALGVAVSERRFQLAFQPVVSLADGKAHHHEVLVRFDGGESPYETIRMAEEFDLIAELDHAVAEQAVRRLKAARDRGLRLAVNVSGRTITSEAFVRHVTDLLARSEIAPGALIFEVTESAAIDDLALADRHIQALRRLGSPVCLDDFGAGSASFAYLRQLTLDIVKIDGRYVRELVEGGRDAAVVRHIVQLCGELNVRTVAEMVETEETEAAVRRLGVDFAQGWRYGLPTDSPQPPMGALARA